jgi:hypothetical protein
MVAFVKRAVRAWFAGSNRSVKKIGLPVTGTKSTIAASVD